MCPTHQKISSKFLHITETVIDGRTRTMWVFQCSYLSKIEKHSFLAFPDRTAPKSVEQITFWDSEQKLARIGESQKKWQ